MALTRSQIQELAQSLGYTTVTGAMSKTAMITAFLAEQADVPEDADADEDNAYSEDELNALNKAQILALATELGYTTVLSGMTKAQMITVFLAEQEAEDTD